MFRKLEELLHLEYYPGSVPVLSFAELYLLVFSPRPPLSRYFSLFPNTPPQCRTIAFDCYSVASCGVDRLSLCCYQVAASVAVVSALYMRVFLPDSIIDANLSTPILSKEKQINAAESEKISTKKIQQFKTLPSLDDMVALLRTRLVYLFPPMAPIKGIFFFFCLVFLF